jgi:hypothetical protein
VGQIKRRKIVLELEGLPYDPVERINPDGSVVMLPPQDAEDEVAAPFREKFCHPLPVFPPNLLVLLHSAAHKTALFNLSHTIFTSSPSRALDILFWRPPTLLAWHSVSWQWQ